MEMQTSTETMVDVSLETTTARLAPSLPREKKRGWLGLLCKPRSQLLAMIVLLLGIALLAVVFDDYSNRVSRTAPANNPGTTSPPPENVATSPTGVVAADHGGCSRMGAEQLRAGGNAVDAAVTTALCLGVVRPYASGLGGGAFILIRRANGTAEVVDAREEAPASAHESMFVGRPEAAVTGGKAIAVPAELSGLRLAWERHGRLPWPRLLLPVASLAEAFEVDAELSHEVRPVATTQPQRHHATPAPPRNPSTTPSPRARVDALA